MSNSFIDALQKQATGKTKNGALAYTDTGSGLLNYFSNVNDLHRSYKDVESDLNKCWAEDPELTLRMIVYVRAITRKSKAHEIQVKGLGMKNEGRLGLKWLYENHREVFYANLPLFIEFGNWQDLWHRDLIGWVSNNDMRIATFIGYNIISQNDLCRKYLPRFKSNSNIHRNTYSQKTIKYKKLKNQGLKLIVKAINTIWSNPTWEGAIDGKMNMEYLMKMKSSGTAHEWQQHITKQDYLKIDFNTLPGKVLTWITKESDNKSFLSRHKLEDNYIQWLDTKPSINTTSFIYELTKPAIEKYKNKWQPGVLSKITKFTIEKQLQTILNRAEDSNLNVMPVIDTSGSMSSEHCANGVTALDVCVSLGVYFSMLQKGSFKDNIIAFDSDSKLKRLSGSYLDRLRDILSDKYYWGSTNFQSVIDLILKTRSENPEIPVEDYPDVYLVVSDMQFDEGDKRYTNHQKAIKKMKEAGLPEPIFIWYNVSSYGNESFQNHKDDAGVIHMSGFDPAAIDRLMSSDFQLKFEEKHNKSIKNITPLEAMVETLNQEYLQLLKLK